MCPIFFLGVAIILPRWHRHTSACYLKAVVTQMQCVLGRRPCSEIVSCPKEFRQSPARCLHPLRQKSDFFLGACHVFFGQFFLCFIPLRRVFFVFPHKSIIFVRLRTGGAAAFPSYLQRFSTLQKWFPLLDKVTPVRL